MKTGIQLSLLFSISLAMAACQSEAPKTEAPAAVPEPQTAATPSAPGERLRAFVPPADGRISSAQVEQYIAVRRRAIELVRQSSAGASPVSALAEMPAAEARAAGELGRDLAEYRWVQARISEASAPELPAGSADVLKAIEASAVKRGAELQKAAQDERRVAAPAPSDPSAVAHNRGVLDPFRTELAAVEKS